jgi:hypothetical protein
MNIHSGLFFIMEQLYSNKYIISFGQYNNETNQYS